MDKAKLKMIDGWILNAGNKLNLAKELIKNRNQYSDVIQASQESIEFSVKSILLLLDIKFPQTHGWDLDSNEITDIIKKIKDKHINELLEKLYLQHLVRLPRFLFLINFWSKFYIAAKYGISKEYFAPANELFGKEESDLSIKHADECHWAVVNLRNKLINQ